MMLSLLSSLALVAAVARAQQRCDVPSPGVFCNTTEILQYESSDCRSFHIFLSRGSDEPYPGRLGNITREICSAIGGDDCGFENIQYPAKSTAWGTEKWCQSAAKGASSGQAQMKAYSEKCPDSKLILLGFSQGGAVAQDILGGGGGQVFACDQVVNPALDASVGSNIVAAVTFGAVVRSRNQNFTVGDGKPFDGKRARTPEQLAALNKYSDRLLDYCHYGDPMCAVGSQPESVEQHLNYFVEHNEEVVDWVTKMVKSGGAVLKPSSSHSASSSSSSVISKSSATASKTSSSIATASMTGSSQAKAAQTSAAKTGSAGALVVDAGAVSVLALISAALLQLVL